MVAAISAQLSHLAVGDRLPGPKLVGHMSMIPHAAVVEEAAGA